jgi:hypothetical protein
LSVTDSGAGAPLERLYFIPKSSVGPEKGQQPDPSKECSY